MNGVSCTNNAPMGLNKQIFDLIMSLWPVYKVGLWAGRQPVIGRLLRPAFSAKIHQVTMIPVNETIQQGEQTILPYSLLEQLVIQASARFMMTECVCRSHEGCQEHSTGLGCLFLGDGAAQIHPSLGRRCSVNEAISHIHRGMDEGLYPLIAHTVIDALTLGIPYKRMLTVCFCCECCCMVYRGLDLGPRSLLQVVQRLPGLKISMGEGCEACEECIAKCPVGAIIHTDHNAQIGEDCIGCGICIKACPYGVIKMEVPKEQDILAGFFERVRSYADITAGPKARNLP